MHKTITLLSLTFLLLFYSLKAHAFPANSLRPGGLVIINVDISSSPKPLVTYQSLPVAVIKGQQNWLAIVGISLKATPGSHHIKITDHLGNQHNKSFRIKPHKYRTQRLTIKNKNKVNPNKKSSTRIEREFLQKQQIVKTFTNTPAKLNFIKPLSGRDSGRFGLRRILNKQKRNPHSGMDIAAPEGHKIKATESGKVIFTGDLFFTGKVVYIDHGSGLISLYAHLSKIKVKKNQIIQRGEIIGNVGKTGRATGAHLHWSVYLNGNAIDPALFIQ